tara:strand:- start:495 stop:1055 length:561 start_codon:yes stop_codon:yes gene_type:complete
MEEDELIPMVGSIEAKDSYSAPPPGHSLTEDNSKWAWGKPPREVEPELVLEQALDSLEKPAIKEELLKLLMVGASVEMLVEGYLIQGFNEGRFNPDVGLLIKGHLALYIANMAEEEGIPYRMFENADALDQGKMDDQTFFRMLNENNPEMFGVIREQINEGIRGGYSMQPAEEVQQSFLDNEEEAQ